LNSKWKVLTLILPIKHDFSENQYGVVVILNQH